MKNNVYAKLTLFVLLVLAVSPVCFGQVYAPQPFSADLTASSGKGRTMTGKMYFSPPNFRMDMNAEGHNVSSIINSSTQTTYMVMHDQHMYMEMHNDQPNPFLRNGPGLPHDFDPKNPCPWEAQHGNTCQKVGTETVNGRLCDKYTGTSKDGKTGTGWIDQKLHYPIKFASSDGSTWDLTNVKEGAQPASLFQPPTGYRKMDMPGMMGGRPPQ
jgi:hypothetical protein